MANQLQFSQDSTISFVGSWAVTNPAAVQFNDYARLAYSSIFPDATSILANSEVTVKASSLPSPDYYTLIGDGSFQLKILGQIAVEYNSSLMMCMF